MQQFVNITLNGLTVGIDLRGLRPVPGADLAGHADRQLRARARRRCSPRSSPWRSSAAQRLATGSALVAALVSRLRARRRRRAGHRPAGRERAGDQRGHRHAGAVRRLPGPGGDHLRQRRSSASRRRSASAASRSATRRSPSRPTASTTSGSVLIAMALLLALFRFTRVGPAHARLGVRPGGRPAARRPRRPDADAGLGAGRHVRLAGRACSSPAASFVYPAYMDSLIVFGFVAAVLGGLDSSVGAIVGGLLLGLALSYVSGYIGSALVNARRAGDPHGRAARQAGRPVLQLRRAEGMTMTDSDTRRVRRRRPEEAPSADAAANARPPGPAAGCSAPPSLRQPADAARLRRRRAAAGGHRPVPRLPARVDGLLRARGRPG